MTQNTNLTSRLTAAVSAFALSFLLISGTVATEAAPQQTAAYIGAVA
ncbi:hypothetical protein B0I00_1857 [Novosphingobium kunmingense]|uniref:Uncharacterized protein n=1 Tax=Novosphingobium kunmingense TaxID=1211806 RepID=A0A2N0HL30_9SPHN|nr:hypothetical protein [Novosphingobium kunmingense]PKB19619.1 hypothetical protein B0I00_1857 [Novosphingobium kunmingense]